MLKITLTAILMLLPFVAVAQDIGSAQSLSRRFSDAEKGSCVTFIQFCPNLHFVFSGSKSHLMSEIFDKLVGNQATLQEHQ